MVNNDDLHKLYCECNKRGGHKKNRTDECSIILYSNGGSYICLGKNCCFTINKSIPHSSHPLLMDAQTDITLLALAHFFL